MSAQVVSEPPPGGRYLNRQRTYDWQGVRANLTGHPGDWLVVMAEIPVSVGAWLRHTGPIVLEDIRQQTQYSMRDTRVDANGRSVATLYARYTPGEQRPGRATIPDEVVVEARERVAAGESRRAVAADMHLDRPYLGLIVSGAARRSAGGPITKKEDA